MLEPHAREAAGLSAADVRNIFVILGAVYFVGMLLAGYVSVKWLLVYSWNVKCSNWRNFSVLWPFLIPCHYIHIGKCADGSSIASGWSSTLSQHGTIQKLIVYMWCSDRFWICPGNAKMNHDWGRFQKYLSKLQTMVSTFSRANNAAIRQGFASDMKTYLVVAGEKMKKM